MRKNLFILVLFVAFGAACKSKKAADSSASTTTSEKAIGNTMGTVSHKYKATGCNTVIIVKQEDGELTLIPKDKLDKEFDVDDKVIMFNYHTLKMPQPEGCSVGIPAEITDISKK
jgi:hypothetical protein